MGHTCKGMLLGGSNLKMEQHSKTGITCVCSFSSYSRLLPSWTSLHHLFLFGGSILFLEYSNFRLDKKNHTLNMSLLTSITWHIFDTGCICSKSNFHSSTSVCRGCSSCHHSTGQQSLASSSPQGHHHSRCVWRCCNCWCRSTQPWLHPALGRLCALHSRCTSWSCKTLLRSILQSSLHGVGLLCLGSRYVLDGCSCLGHSTWHSRLRQHSVEQFFLGHSRLGCTCHSSLVHSRHICCHPFVGQPFHHSRSGFCSCSLCRHNSVHLRLHVLAPHICHSTCVCGSCSLLDHSTLRLYHQLHTWSWDKNYLGKHPFHGPERGRTSHYRRLGFFQWFSLVG